MSEKDKNPRLNTTQNPTPKQQLNYHLKSAKTWSNNEELKRNEYFADTQGWNYGIPGWYIERY
ncbi:MAG: hypothetical protein QNJ68_05815 [Microcoleaceae cyanobacterium MO_207.B10]|nr:hypothetical protein [Microcoleaceae cyanobacterium MO_207.B10]